MRSKIGCCTKVLSFGHSDHIIYIHTILISLALSRSHSHQSWSILYKIFPWVRVFWFNICIGAFGIARSGVFASLFIISGTALCFVYFFSSLLSALFFLIHHGHKEGYWDGIQDIISDYGKAGANGTGSVGAIHIIFICWKGGRI